MTELGNSFHLNVLQDSSEINFFGSYREEKYLPFFDSSVSALVIVLIV